MIALMLSLVLSVQADSTSERVGTSQLRSSLETREPRWSLPIYRQPDTRSTVRGRLLKDEAFYILERVERDCIASTRT